MTEKQKVLWQRWLRGIGLSIVVAMFSYGWFVYRTITDTFEMTNQIYQEVKSPDGRYAATLVYRDGMTFGFGYICLQEAQCWRPLKPNDPLPKSEVIEVAAEGLAAISWKGNHMLIVTYGTSGNEAAQFVTQPQQWHDVKIIYRGTK